MADDLDGFDDGDDDPELVRLEWGQEIERRIRAAEEGRSSSEDAATVLKRVRDELTSRAAED